jgi:two-component system, chemotaxis family, sensor kinase CheA
MKERNDERAAELRELFFESAEGLLQALNDGALQLEKQPADTEIVRGIRRTVHTLKGDAAACGYRDLSEIAHKMEDALALESACKDASLVDVVLDAADLFGAMLSAYRQGEKPPSTTALKNILRKLVAKAPAETEIRGRKGSKKAIPWTEYEQLAITQALNAGRILHHVHVTLDPHCALPLAGKQLVLSALASIGDVLAQHPPAAAPVVRTLAFVIATSSSAAHIAAKAKIPTVASKVKVELFDGPKSKVTLAQSDRISPSEAVVALDQESNHNETAGAAAGSAHLENILRVDADRIDNVLNLVGELIIAKSMLQQTLNELVAGDPRHPVRGKFVDAMAFQARVLNDLQRSVMKIRMVPVDQLFRRFPRLARDVARQCGKNVELAISGEHTDLDKGILDTIAEPLTHLVRNAIGHGIETAQERLAAVKPQQGTVRLNAYHQANQVVVEISDDGRGIDIERVRATAIEKKFVTSEELARLNETEVLQLIFRPGFSTAQEITEISGRGVGMDVVQSVIQRLKGSVDVDSRPGSGTTFRLRLPLTLAIIKAILFRVENRLYAIPLNSVAEIARTTESEVHKVDHYEILTLREEVLPLVRLGRRPLSESGSQKNKVFVLVITVAERKFGLIVDSLDGEEELVIKALDDQAISTNLVSGASIMGDGRVVLVLNLAAIIEQYTRVRPRSGETVSEILLPHADRSSHVNSASVGGNA